MIIKSILFFHIIVFRMNLQNGEFRIGILYRICFSARNVFLCMNGHDHGDAVIEKNGTTYYTVNSSSNVWIGSQIDSSETLKEKYGHLNGILTYKEPFAVIVEIDDSKIKINGVEGEYQSVTPEDIGLDNYQWNGVSILPKASSWEINMN